MSCRWDSRHLLGCLSCRSLVYCCVWRSSTCARGLAAGPIGVQHAGSCNPRSCAGQPSSCVSRRLASIICVCRTTRCYSSTAPASRAGIGPTNSCARACRQGRRRCRLRLLVPVGRGSRAPGPGRRARVRLQERRSAEVLAGGQQRLPQVRARGGRGAAALQGQQLRVQVDAAAQVARAVRQKLRLLPQLSLWPCKPLVERHADHLRSQQGVRLYIIVGHVGRANKG